MDASARRARQGEARSLRPGGVTWTVESIQAGVAAGIVGGLAMLAFLATYAVATGRYVLEPLQLVGAVFYGPGALSASAGVGPVFWGLVIHLAVSAALAVPFALLMRGDLDPMVTTSAGIVYGLLAWLVLTFLVLPIVDPVMRRAMPDMAIGWFAAHVPYGAALALADQFRAILGQRERRLQET